jgi:drug/metabolite transporter (DMT)-like permease
VAGRKSPAPSVALGVEVVGLVAIPLALWLLPLRLDPSAALLAFAGGAVGGFGLILFYRAMAMNLIGVVAPITAVVAASLPVAVGVIAGGENLHPGQVVGILAGLVAIVLINGGGRTAGEGARNAVALAIVAGLCFGFFFVLFHTASPSGATAFVAGRLGSGVIAVVFALLSRVSFVPRRAALPLIAPGGTLDGVGVVLYLYATFHGLLSLSALLTSFYPAFTVLCARIFLRERLNTVQAAGAVLAVISVALIAAT